MPASAVPRPFLNQTEFEAIFFSAFANLHSLLTISFSKILDIIGVIKIGLYSSGNWVGILPFRIGVTLAMIQENY